MKKTHYLAVLSLVIVAGLSIGTAFAETEANTQNKPSLWNRIFNQKTVKDDAQKIKIEERRASTTAKIEDRLERQASTTVRLEDRLEKRASTTKKIEERADRMASSTEERKLRLEEKFKVGVSNKIAKVNDRLEDAINRLKLTDQRITDHIARLKANNVTTTNADALLISAEAKLLSATEKVTTLNTSLQTILASNISTTTKNSIKAKTSEANAYVKTAHEAFIKVVESLKPGQNKTGTSTATTTTP